MPRMSQRNLAEAFSTSRSAHHCPQPVAMFVCLFITAGYYCSLLLQDLVESFTQEGEEDSGEPVLGPVEPANY
jgi:hypothetical protein